MKEAVAATDFYYALRYVDPTKKDSTETVYFKRGDKIEQPLLKRLLALNPEYVEYKETLVDKGDDIKSVSVSLSESSPIKKKKK